MEEVSPAKSRVKYPKFKYSWCDSLFIHFISHGGGNKDCFYEKNVADATPKKCEWCQVEGVGGMHIPLTEDGHDTRLHEVVVDIVLRPAVTKIVRDLFLDIHQQADGSNTASLHKGRLTREQCHYIIDNCTPESNVTTLGAYNESCDNKLRTLLDKYNIPYRRLLSERQVNQHTEEGSDTKLSLVESLFTLPTRVGQYAPLVEQTTAFGIVSSRCARLCVLGGSRRLPNPDDLTLSDISFLLYCMHREGLVALTPSHNLNGLSSVIPTDVISHLLDKQSNRDNYQSLLQQKIQQLESILYETAVPILSSSS